MPINILAINRLKNLDIPSILLNKIFGLKICIKFEIKNKQYDIRSNNFVSEKLNRYI